MNEKDGRSLTSEYFYNNTCKVIPDGVQTLSKMPSKHVEGVYPIYLERGDGAYVWDTAGNRYIDYPCGLGSVLLGYNYPAVNEAIKKQLAKGTIFSLPHRLETKLAEKIVELIPCAEMVRFLKTGSEATSAAVRIARAYTGNYKILCCGYHGWHDWYNFTTPKNKGVEFQHVLQFGYNDIPTLEERFANYETAAVIMEPYVYDAPKDNFLQKVRDLCTKHGALLIFDEVVTGFRTKGFSAQKMFNITPDLACFGKAMANGLPISFVCGKKEIMEELRGDCFVSSTFGGELLSIAAALATIEVLERENVIERVWEMGTRLCIDFNTLAEHRAQVDAKCIGYPPRTFFKFPTESHKSLFWQECLKRGILFGYAQFINYSHSREILGKTFCAIDSALQCVAERWDNPAEALEGKPAKETMRLVSTR